MSKEPAAKANEMGMHIANLVLGGAFTTSVGKALQMALERGYEGIEIRFVKKVQP